ncbi:IclR family transcriptional regulator [Neobacillus rhizophilus]|uniref:IclR family transcriptional regulator n=1 Tax=Neobacillus rhizophilus TaxID=2833579 RepID=A0A942YUC2_9BACI|nr:IclR family transcriptional regulator [Neobacillus rhizophilus]MBS4213853.1 IclR family transcriptional regulator [Neobacillus rhizophilus]
MSKTVKKALQLLDIFTEQKPYWKLDEISTFTGVPKPTCLRLLRTFVELGYLKKMTFQQEGLVIDGESYGLGLKFLEMGERVAGRFDIRPIAYPYMKKLQEQFNEAIQLITREQDEGVYIEKVESTLPVRLYTKVGRHAPLYAGACPRAILAYLPEGKIQEILDKPMTKYASQTPLTKEDVLLLIKQIRESGYSYSDSELEEGTASIGVPIFNSSGAVQYALSVASFSTSLPRAMADHFVGPLWEAAAEISKKLGYNHPYPYGKPIAMKQT